MSVANEIIKIVDKKTYQDNGKIEEYTASISKFEKMVESGVAKHRGNNLMSLSDQYKRHVRFNVGSLHQ